jgi:hypothetical protein
MTPGERPRSALLLALPAAALLLVLYWPGLRCWFLADDFAWLGLTLQVKTPADLLDALFAPKAQGTIRPWSERLFFMGFYSVFGLDALPFRIWVFLTQIVNLVLLASLVRRVSGSDLAASLAGILWIANASLAVPLSWNAAYNQILCSAFLMAALRLWIAYTDTGVRKWYLAAWAVFLLGFGALEINVVFPGIALAWAVLSGRRNFLLPLAPMFGASLVYALIHRSIAPRHTSGPYTMHWDGSLLATLGKYVELAFGGPRLEPLDLPAWFEALGAWSPWLLSVPLALFAARLLRERRWTVLMPAAWFLAILAPVLPLRDHVTDYYLAGPTIGLAWLGAWAVAQAWRNGRLLRVAGIALAGIYIAVSAPAARAVADYNLERSRRVRDLVLGAARARELHPGKIILVTGVSGDQFWAGMVDSPFRLLGVSDVFLAPGSENYIPAHPELGDVTQFVLPAAPTLDAIARNRIVVYDASQAKLRNITRSYSHMAPRHLKPELPRRVDPGHPSFASQLGEGWYPIENGYRWMAQRAVVWLGGPRGAGERLHVAGFCPASQLAAGTLTLHVSIDGARQPPVAIGRPGEEFHAEFPLPAALRGKEKIEVILETNRVVVTEGDGRPLGLAFGSLSIR